MIPTLAQVRKTLRGTPNSLFASCRYGTDTVRNWLSAARSAVTPSSASGHEACQFVHHGEWLFSIMAAGGQLSSLSPVC